MEKNKKKINPLDIVNFLFNHYGMSIIDPNWFNLDLNLTADDCNKLIKDSSDKLVELRLLSKNDCYVEKQNFSSAEELIAFFKKSRSLYEHEDEFYLECRVNDIFPSWKIVTNDIPTVDDFKTIYTGTLIFKKKKNNLKEDLEKAILEHRILLRSVNEISNPAVALLKHHRDVVSYIGRQMKFLMEYEELCLPDSFDELIDMVRNNKPLNIRVINICNGVVGARCNQNVAHYLEPQSNWR